MMLDVLMLVVAVETVWLLTIYGHRFFGWWDRAQARLDEADDAFEADQHMAYRKQHWVKLQ
jgi:hypothetical protein